MIRAVVCTRVARFLEKRELLSIIIVLQGNTAISRFINQMADDLVTNLYWGILCDQDQALNAIWRVHRHHCGNLSPKAIAEDMGFFNLQDIHCAQHSLGHLSPIKFELVLQKGPVQLTRSKL